MNKHDIVNATMAGTALYHSTNNGWADFSERHGRKVIVLDGVAGHWMYDYNTSGYVKRATASSFYRSMATNGYLVQEESGRQFIARAAHLRGTWTACQDIVAANRRTRDELRTRREDLLVRNACVRQELEAFGIATMTRNSNDAAGTVTLDAGALLELLRSLRDAA